MKITNSMRAFVMKHYSVALDAAEDLVKASLQTALKENKLTPSEFAQLANDDGPTPEEVFGSGENRKALNNKKSTAVHVKTGQPVRNEFGREVGWPTEHEFAKSGAFLKQLAARGGITGIAMHKQDRDLIEETYLDRWCGKYQAQYVSGLPGSNVKAVLNDSVSGGAELVPEWFDDNIVTFPLLTGELFPLVDLRPVPRANSVEGGSIGNPTATWGTREGTGIALFNTSNLISEINTSIHSVTVAIEVGRDMLADSPADVGRILVEAIGNRMAAELDRVIATGNGTTEPQGLTVASGLASVNADNGGSGPPTISDYETLMFAVPKQYRTKAMRPTFISNDVSYRRSRLIRVDPQVASTDQRPVFGLEAVNSYSTLDWPHKIQGNIGNQTAMFGAMSCYRLYRRQGFEVHWETGGRELATKNLALLIVRGRFGGRVVDANGFAKWTDGQS